MKHLLATLGMALALVTAAQAHAEPGIDESPGDENNDSFIANLKQVGIGFSDAGQAVSAGQAVCGALHNGMHGLHLIQHLQESNPALTESGAAQFAMISAKAYCPKQLEDEHEPGKKYLKGTSAGKGETSGEGTAPKGSGGGGGGE